MNVGSVLAIVFSLLGCLVVVSAALGLWLLPDALSRQHAGTKAATLGIALIILGAACLHPERLWIIKLFGIFFFLVFTLPVASHLLARAAVIESDLTNQAEEAGGTRSE